MTNTILIIMIIGLLMILGQIALAVITWRRVATCEQMLGRQYSLLVKVQTTLRNKSATNAVAEHAEVIYQDLLQNLIPIMAAIDVMPRATSEHALWRSLGGIMDEYAKNPFTLEKLRRAIKLDTNVARNVENYMARADAFLQHLNTTEANGILAATFTDGLLGQSLTFFAQAKQLAARTDAE